MATREENDVYSFDSGFLVNGREIGRSCSLNTSKEIFYVVEEVSVGDLLGVGNPLSHTTRSGTPSLSYDVNRKLRRCVG